MTTMPGFTADSSLYTSARTYHGTTPTAGTRPRTSGLTAAQDADTSGQCTSEGFFADPNDCTRFYRCVDFEGDGSFTRFDFQCGPGTMYHPELVTCVHPWQMPPGSACTTTAS